MWQYNYNRPCELYHHGILGQKWGNRNGPPYPLGSSDHSASEKKAGWKKSLDSSGSGSSSKTTKNSSDKKQKSTHRQKLEAKYKKEGMSQEDAEVAANRRIKAEKVVAVAAGVAVTAAVAYAVHNKYTKEYADRVIKSGTLFQRITRGDEDLDNPFYAAYKGRDKVIYKGLYGQQLNAQSKWLRNSDGAYNLGIKATQDIKVPSRQTASEVFQKLYKSDNSFRETVNQEFFDFGNMKWGNNKQQSLINKVSNAVNQTLSDKTLAKEGYDAFNVGLYSHDSKYSGAATKFYNELKSLGYNAVTDINDSKYSGFKSSNPLIVFDMDSVVKESVKKLTDKELKNNYIAQDLIRNGSTYAAELGILGAGLYETSKNREDSTNNKNKKK